MGSDMASLEEALQVLAGAAAASAPACTLQGCDTAAVCLAAGVVYAGAAAVARCCMARPTYAAALCQLLQAAARDAASGAAPCGDATGCGDVLAAVQAAVTLVLVPLAGGASLSAPPDSATPTAAAAAETQATSSTSLPLAYAMGSALLQSGVLASLARGAGCASQRVAGEQRRSRRCLAAACASVEMLRRVEWAVLTPIYSRPGWQCMDDGCGRGWYVRQLVQQVHGSATLEHMCTSIACICHALLQQASAATRRRRLAAGGQDQGGGPGPSAGPGLGQPAQLSAVAAAAAGPGPGGSHCHQVRRVAGSAIRHGAAGGGSRVQSCPLPSFLPSELARYSCGG